MYMYVNKNCCTVCFCILGFNRDLSSQKVFYDLQIGTILKQTILTNANLIGYEGTIDSIYMDTILITVPKLLYKRRMTVQY